MNPSKLVLTIVVALSSQLGNAQELPNTISKEAKEFLKTAFDNPLQIPNSLEGWRELQELLESQGSKASNAVVGELETEIEIREFGGIPVHVVTPKNADAQHADKVIIHSHGGGYCLNSAASTLNVCAPIADLTKLRVYCIDYRLAPQHPFPSGLDDCVKAYTAIVGQVSPERVAIIGESAGGGMAMAMALRVMRSAVKKPTAIVAITPWVDLTLSGETYVTHDALDPVLNLPDLRLTVKAYVGKLNPKDPLISPVFAEYPADFPATLIQTGTRDVLLSDCSRLHRKLKKAGVDASLTVYEGMWHAFHVIPDTSLPESEAARQEIAGFLSEQLKE